MKIKLMLILTNIIMYLYVKHNMHSLLIKKYRLFKMGIYIFSVLFIFQMEKHYIL